MHSPITLPAFARYQALLNPFKFSCTSVQSICYAASSNDTLPNESLVPISYDRLDRVVDRHRWRRQSRRIDAVRAVERAAANAGSDVHIEHHTFSRQPGQIVATIGRIELARISEFYGRATPPYESAWSVH